MTEPERWKWRTPWRIALFRESASPPRPVEQGVWSASKETARDGGYIFAAAPQCGHIGCCDSSPSQHASAHARTVGHPVMRSFEPGEDWFYEHTTKKFFRGPRLPDPQSRPPEQPAPPPADKVPEDWREHLHR